MKNLTTYHHWITAWGKALLFPLFLILFCQPVLAQNDSLQAKQEVHYDKRSGLQPVRFNSEQIKSFKNDPDLDYQRQPDTKNWWQQFKAWLAYIIKSVLESLFGSITAGSWLYTVLKVLKYLFIAGVIFLIAWLFAKLNPGKAMLKPKSPPEVLLSEDERIIRQNDIPTLIREALQQENYRLAVRYYYLLVLKSLKDRDLITYAYEKTNQEYQSELKDQRLSGQFKRLTRMYDFIWYGDFPVDQQQYALAENQFDRLLKAIKHHTDD